jgi:predicted XRE-type DNA-binding protein
MKHSEPRLIVFGNVSEMLGKEGVEAQEFNTRCSLMTSIAEYVKSSKMTQAQVAEILGVDQPRVSDLVRGKFSKFSLGTLIEFLWKLEFEVSVGVRPPGKKSQDKKTAIPSNINRRKVKENRIEDELELI